MSLEEDTLRSYEVLVLKMFKSVDSHLSEASFPKIRPMDSDASYTMRHQWLTTANSLHFNATKI